MGSAFAFVLGVTNDGTALLFLDTTHAGRAARAEDAATERGVPRVAASLRGDSRGGGRARPPAPLGGVPAGRRRQRGTGEAPRDRSLLG
eukprot:scaffold66234_cov62-Phaeocystis_antarctica.AAC.11